VPLLRANLAQHEQAGEERLASTCRDLLRRAGAPTRRGRGAGPVPARLRAAGVTSREFDVLRLVRDGLPNAEIAARLYVSTRTVETHVAHLLAKSGTADRTALARWSLDD
jgi:DNA-binding NarL/FixJ family response regulator